MKCPHCEEWLHITCPIHGVIDLAAPPSAPIPMLLWCPTCGHRHVDEGEFATKPHHTHACQLCGNVWRPALVTTVGVQFLPGFRNLAKERSE